MEKTIQFTLLMEKYLNYCESRKNLDQKTVKSYRIDLQQYNDFIKNNLIDWVEKNRSNAI